MSTPLSPEQRIQRLKLCCRMDRLNYRLLLQPRPPVAPGLLGTLSNAWVKEFLGLAQWVPGRIGRWSRRFSLGFLLVARIREALQHMHRPR